MPGYLEELSNAFAGLKQKGAGSACIFFFIPAIRLRTVLPRESRALFTEGRLRISGSAAQFLKTPNSYLVDPASSHMLVSKIKPCMSKYKHLYTVKLRTAH